MCTILRVKKYSEGSLSINPQTGFSALASMLLGCCSCQRFLFLFFFSPFIWLKFKTENVERIMSIGCRHSQGPFSDWPAMGLGQLVAPVPSLYLIFTSIIVLNTVDFSTIYYLSSWMMSFLKIRTLIYFCTPGPNCVWHRNILEKVSSDFLSTRMSLARR